MANDFSSRSDCLALYKFETGAPFVQDSKNSYHLTNSATAVAEDATHAEGSIAAKFVANSFLSIADASLPNTWPWKNGQANGPNTISCFVYPTTVDANDRVIWAKFDTSKANRGIKLTHSSSYLRVTIHNYTAYRLSFSPLVANQWSHVTIWIDYANLLVTSMIRNMSTGAVAIFSSAVSGFGSNDAPFYIGADVQLAANKGFLGNIDEFVVFNSLVTPLDVSAISGGLLPIASGHSYWHIDPVNGNNLNAGVSWATAKIDLTGVYAIPGDTIKVAKSPETAAAGTVTVTNGSFTIATTNDLSAVCPAYTIIRIGGRDNLYVVRSITSSAITLYRPYREASGGSLGLTYFASIPITAPAGFQPVSMLGTIDSNITLTMGINTADESQDGFTIISGNNVNNEALKGTWNYVNLSRFAAYNWNYGGFGAVMNGCNLQLCFNIRCGSFFGYGGSLSNSVVGTFVSINSGAFVSWIIANTVFDVLETSQSAAIGMSLYYGYNLNIKLWRDTTLGSIGALYVNTSNFNVRIDKAIINEAGLNYPSIRTTSTCSASDVCINQLFGGVEPLYSIGFTQLYGTIKLSCVAGDPTDNREYKGAPENYRYFSRTTDYTNYHTVAPSAKISFLNGFTGINTYPVSYTHYIPCAAGVAKTVSVWVRKNSTYGSITRPIMRLRWYTGSAPNLVTNVYDVTMPDTNDEFVELSHAVTPSIAGVIIVELIFQSAAVSGAIAWYDDLGAA